MHLIVPALRTAGPFIALRTLGPFLAAPLARPTQEQPVVQALQKLREDLEQLDVQAGRRLPRLGPAEGLALVSSVAIAAASPVAFTEKVVEVVIPACALLVAAIGVAAEYAGRVATASGKEVSSLSLKAAAEAESLLAAAERSKTPLHFNVGLSASAAVLALVMPGLIRGFPDLAPFKYELLLICPLTAMYASITAALSECETVAWSDAACTIGKTTAPVGREWSSQREMVATKKQRERARWESFAWVAIPPPVCALLVKGGFGFKAIIATAIAAVQAAYYLVTAEAAIARATAVVAMKERTAAVADTYANQAARVGAVLPFTSALGGLCAAFAAIIVELQPAASAVFPAIGALVAAAASVSKACCQADAQAALSAVEQLGVKEEDPEDKFPGGNKEPFGIFEPVVTFFKDLLPSSAR